MPSHTPFFDADGAIDLAGTLSEALPIAELVGLFVVVSLVPFAVAVASFGTNSLVGSAFVLVGQSVLAVGAGVVLLYVLVRSRRLSAG